MSDPSAGTVYETLTNKGPAAIANNLAFLAIQSPTDPQAVAQVQALTRQVDAIIRIMLNLTADATGT